MEDTEKRGIIRPFKTMLESFFNLDVTTTAIPRVVYKLLVLVLCTLGCIYQVWTYMEMYLEYPTTVDVDIIYPEYILSPAITLCNYNAFRKDKFCLHNPDLCKLTERGEEVCGKDPQLCQNDTVRVYYMLPEMDYLDEELNRGTIKRLDTFGHDHTMFKHCHVSWAPDIDVCREDMLTRVNSYGSFDIPLNCYTINSLVKKPPTKASYIPLITQDEGNYIQLIVDFEPMNYFQPKRQLEMMLSIHYPYSNINSHRKGKSIRVGKSYNILIKPESFTLLPAPFKTNCTDYLERWAATNRTSPASKERCVSECMIKMTSEQCQCYCIFQPNYREDIPDNETTCLRSSDRESCVNKVNPSGCFKKCNKDCKYLNYDLTVFESEYDNPPEYEGYYDPDFGIHNLGFEEEDIDTYFLPIADGITPFSNIFSKDRYSLITIQLIKPELLAYVQKPKFQTIEVFGYVGGYIGMWLGFALVEINDFLDFQELIKEYLINRKSKVKNVS